MIQKIVTGYGQLLVSLLKVLALIVLCALFSLVLVLPLWKSTFVAPETYSHFVLLLLACETLFFSGKSIHNFLTVGFPTHQEQKNCVRLLLKGLVKTLIILLCVCGIIIYILNKALALAWTILLTIIIYGVLAFGTKKRKNNSFHKIFLFSVLCCLCLLRPGAQMPTMPVPMDLETEPIDRTTLPVITTLSSRNKEFASYMQQVEKSYQNISARKNFQPGFYLYTVTADDKSLPVRNLVSLAARCNIPYGEIALLNDLTSAEEDLTGKTLILPDAPGLFVPLSPSTSIGNLVKKRLAAPQLGSGYTIDGKNYQYFPEERLTPTELAFFLDTNLRMPLDNSVLTSDFGSRVSPITGMNHQHKGIDLAAPEGTKVYACTGGIVAIASVDSIYGNYIILDHENNIQSVYAHLSAKLVETGDRVSRGTVIGKVGSTGASTGPHLHFEIRVNGASQDPRRLLPSI